MPWPIEKEQLLNQFLAHWDTRPKTSGATDPCCDTFSASSASRSSLLAYRLSDPGYRPARESRRSRFVVDRACFVKRFLDWLVGQGLVDEQSFYRTARALSVPVDFGDRVGPSSQAETDGGTGGAPDHCRAMQATWVRSCANTWRECVS